MMQVPTITTDRLILRPFHIQDAADVQRLAGDWSIADTTLNVPHPYEDGMAEEWIATHQPRFDARELVTFAITLRNDEQLAGALSLKISGQFDMAELGYWIARDFWNRGFCTEAAIAAIHYGFDVLGLNRIHANHLASSVYSRRFTRESGRIVVQQAQYPITRIIHLDASAPPDDFVPSKIGYSTGLHYSHTLTDPEYLTVPVTISFTYNKIADHEYVYEECDTDSARIPLELSSNPGGQET
jgi:RimJ/RimL family protein N-acetyltransferase